MRTPGAPSAGALELDFDEEDRADEDTLNRILWFSVRGNQPYPGDR